VEGGGAAHPHIYRAVNARVVLDSLNLPWPCRFVTARNEPRNMLRQLGSVYGIILAGVLMVAFVAILLVTYSITGGIIKEVKPVVDGPSDSQPSDIKFGIGWWLMGIAMLGIPTAAGLRLLLTRGRSQQQRPPGGPRF